MRLLLILSALLSAMVGFGAPSSAVAQPTCAVAASAHARAERANPQTAELAGHPFANANRTEPRLLAAAEAIYRLVPLYAERLRI